MIFVMLHLCLEDRLDCFFPSCGPDNPQTVYMILNAIDYILKSFLVEMLVKSKYPPYQSM